MRKLCINLLLVFGMNFSVFGSDSERQLIYEEEYKRSEKFQSFSNSVEFVYGHRSVVSQSSEEIADQIENFLKHPGDKAAAVIIVHTKISFDPNDKNFKEKAAMVRSFMSNLGAYDKLSPEERRKQIQQHLKRDGSDDQSTTGTHDEPTFSKVWPE